MPLAIIQNSQRHTDTIVQHQGGAIVHTTPTPHIREVKDALMVMREFSTDNTTVSHTNFLKALDIIEAFVYTR